MREKLTIWLAWKLPRTLVYWCAIRLMAHATQGKHSGQPVPELTGIEALRRWQNTKHSDNRVIDVCHMGIHYPSRFR